MTEPFGIRRSLTVLAVAIGFAVPLAASSALPAAEVPGWRSEGPFVGTVADVAFDPRTPGVAYAASSSGGVFRSTNGGKSWTHAGGPRTGSNIEWIEVDPGTPGTLWVGVDNPGNPALWRSRDHGATWKIVTDNYSGQLSTLHPTGNRIAFAASRPGDIWVPSTNLHYRSRDGGKSWSDFRVASQDAYAIAVDPKNPDIVYAGGHGGEQAHLSRSDDGGKSWKPIGQGLERFEPGRSTHLWIATEKGLFRSPDGGGSWERSDRDTGRYILHSVAFDPAEPQKMLAASSGGGVYRSSNGGASWEPSARCLRQLDGARRAVRGRRRRGRARRSALRAAVPRGGLGVRQLERLAVE